MKRKLRGRRVWKWKPWVGVKSARSGTGLQNILRLMQRLIRQSMEISANSELPIARYNICTKARCIWKGIYGEGEPKNVNLVLVRKAHRPWRACKQLRALKRSIGPSMEICANSELPIASYNVCTKAKCKWKGSNGEGDPKNVNIVLVRKAHLPWRACKLPRVLQRW